MTKQNTTGFFTDNEGNFSSSRLITAFLVLLGAAVLLIMLFGRTTDKEGNTILLFSVAEMISLLSTVMGFALSWKIQSKIGENRELRIKEETKVKEMKAA